MEYALREQVDDDYIRFESLNPCFNGICSARGALALLVTIMAMS